MLYASAGRLWRVTLDNAVSPPAWDTPRVLAPGGDQPASSLAACALPVAMGCQSQRAGQGINAGVAVIDVGNGQRPGLLAVGADGSFFWGRSRGTTSQPKACQCNSASPPKGAGKFHGNSGG